MDHARLHFAYALVVSVLLATLGGCSINRTAVNTTASILSDAEHSTRRYFDWKSAGYAAPSGIMQLEGLHTISPDNEELTLILVKAYMAYAYGWVMDDFELAQRAADEPLAEHHRQRAYLMYSRARDLALKVMHERDPGFLYMAHQDSKAFAKYLEETFDDPEDDVPPLFWLMMSWSSAINNSPDVEEMIDMPSIKVIAQWIERHDPTYEDGGALVFLGGLASSYPKQVGGDPELGKKYFDRALRITERRSHIVLVNYATLYAVNVQDRALFLALLHEIIEAPDQGDAYRLANKVAKRRALRLLTRVDELFLQ